MTWVSFALGLTQQKLSNVCSASEFEAVVQHPWSCLCTCIESMSTWGQSTAVVSEDAALACDLAPCVQALDDDEMMRQYAALLLRQDTAREEALLALQARTAMRAEVAGLEVGLMKF